MINIAVDGTSASGKSSVCRELAKKLGILHINTGELYRTVAYYFYSKDIDVTENFEQYISDIDLSININNNKFEVLINGQNVSDKIHNPQIAEITSVIAQNAKIREVIKRMQLDIANNFDVILEGRDIGTEILPNAKHKFFITASLDERARRRYLQLIEQGKEAKFNDVRDSISARDFADRTRKISPLRTPKDAIYVDTTRMSFDEVVNFVYNEIIKKEKDTCITF